MKYTNIYTHFLFLLAFQQINSSKSGSKSKSKEVKKPSPQPPKQEIPRLITAKERDSLLDLIKTDNDGDIVSFFNTNNLIDYPLIRFQSTDDVINGYTPLAAAIRHCSKNAAKVLAPLQFTYPWTITVAPHHSLPEIAAKYCPSLLIEAIEKYMTEFPLAPMIQNLEFNQLTEIIRSVDDKNSKLTDEERVKLIKWIDSTFNIKFKDQMNEILKDDIATKAVNKKTKQNYSDIDLLIQKWIESGLDAKPLIEIFKNQGVTSLYSLAAIELMKSGQPKEFLRLYKELDSDKQLQAETFRKAAVYISVEHLQHFDESFKQELREYFATLDVDKHSEYFRKSTDMLISNTPYMYSVVIGNDKGFDIDLGSLSGGGLSSLAGLLGSMAELQNILLKMLSGSTNLDPKVAAAIIKGANKMVPYAYSHFIKRYPHIDTAIDMYELDQVQVIWVGDDKSIDGQTDFTGFTKNLVQAYTTDDANELQNLFETTKWGSKTPEELRFNFAPYNLSLIKTAVMLKKPKILNYLMSRPDASLHLATKHQLTAMEMAACYQPDFLIEHILPIIGKSCKKRLRAANNLIAMFKETLLQKCPTGAKNAPKVLPKLITSNKESETACIDFYKKDAIEEAFKHNYPAELMIAFHATGKYVNNEFYISLAAKRGDTKLFNYFVSQKKANEPSQATEEALATWVRSSDGLLNERNINTLEFFLKHKDVKLNSIMQDSGMSALSFAVQRSFVWIVKRLLLEKDLDVNIPDSNTLTTPIQHAINIFRTFIFAEEAKEHWIIKFAYKVAKQLDYDLNQSDVRDNVEKFYNWLKGKKVENLLSDQSHIYKIIIHAFKDLNMDHYGGKLKGRNCLESMPIFLEILNELIVKLPEIEKLLQKQNFIALVDLKYNSNAISFEYIKFAVYYCRDLLQEGFAKLGELQSNDLNSKPGKYTADSGLLHNVLLSHPAIDTTVENAASVDALYITKKRAMYLVGDDDGADEMARTHVRVRNVDALHDGKRNYKRITVGLVSTLIVGTVSAGIIRLIL